MQKLKKALMNASVASMIYSFNMNNLSLIEEFDYKVDIFCDFNRIPISIVSRKHIHVLAEWILKT